MPSFVRSWLGWSLWPATAAHSPCWHTLCRRTLLFIALHHHSGPCTGDDTIYYIRHILYKACSGSKVLGKCKRTPISGREAPEPSKVGCSLTGWSKSNYQCYLTHHTLVLNILCISQICSPHIFCHGDWLGIPHCRLCKPHRPSKCSIFSGPNPIVYSTLNKIVYRVKVLPLNLNHGPLRMLRIAAFRYYLH